MHRFRAPHRIAPIRLIRASPPMHKPPARRQSPNRRTPQLAHILLLTLDILTTAAILFAVAAGLMIILGVMKLINFAHGLHMTTRNKILPVPPGLRLFHRGISTGSLLLGWIICSC